MNDFTGLG